MEEWYGEIGVLWFYGVFVVIFMSEWLWEFGWECGVGFRWLGLLRLLLLRCGVSINVMWDLSRIL